MATSNLAPKEDKSEQVEISMPGLSYTLWVFQEEILAGLGEETLTLGLPTGLGKTYLLELDCTRDHHIAKVKARGGF